MRALAMVVGTEVGCPGQGRVSVEVHGACPDCWDRLSRLLTNGSPETGLALSTAVWTVPGDTLRASVTRSMRSSHRDGGEAEMMTAASRTVRWTAPGRLSCAVPMTQASRR